MFGGQDGLRRMMSQDTLKPKRLGDTLARFGRYFKAYWPILILVGILVIAATWAQVTAPELIGQAVDCYLTPAAVAAFEEIIDPEERAIRLRDAFERVHDLLMRLGLRGSD